MKDNAKPRVFHTLAHVLIYWQKQVEADRIKGEKLSVLERFQFVDKLMLLQRNKIDNLEEL